MSFRSPRHLKPGQRNLRGKRSKLVCPCCADVMDHREKHAAKLAEREMRLGSELEEIERKKTNA